MTVLKNKKTSVSDGTIFEPFPEPHTMPEGWDLSSIYSDGKVNVKIVEIIDLSGSGSEK